jgi:hypothetical protein
VIEYEYRGAEYEYRGAEYESADGLPGRRAT